jgi:hypothetical protein
MAWLRLPKTPTEPTVESTAVKQAAPAASEPEAPTPEDWKPFLDASMGSSRAPDLARPWQVVAPEDSHPALPSKGPVELDSEEWRRIVQEQERKKLAEDMARDKAARAKAKEEEEAKRLQKDTELQAEIATFAKEDTQLYSWLARHVAYENSLPAGTNEILADWGYVSESSVRHLAAGLDVEVVWSTRHARNIVVFRGTEPSSLVDLLALLDPIGVGFSRWRLNQEAIRQILLEAGPNCILAGHSAGGAYVQYAMGAFPELVSEGWTFQSAGTPGWFIRAVNAGNPRIHNITHAGDFARVGAGNIGKTLVLDTPENRSLLEKHRADLAGLLFNARVTGVEPPHATVEEGVHVRMWELLRQMFSPH